MLSQEIITLTPAKFNEQFQEFYYGDLIFTNEQQGDERYYQIISPFKIKVRVREFVNGIPKSQYKDISKSELRKLVENQTLTLVRSSSKKEVLEIKKNDPTATLNDIKQGLKGGTKTTAPMASGATKTSFELGDVFLDAGGDEIWLSDADFIKEIFVFSLIKNGELKSQTYLKISVEGFIKSGSFKFLFNDKALIGVTQDDSDINMPLKDYPYGNKKPSEASKQLQSFLNTMSGTSTPTVQLGDLLYHIQDKNSRFWISGQTQDTYLISLGNQSNISSLSTVEYPKAEVTKLIQDGVWVLVRNDSSLVGLQNPNYTPLPKPNISQQIGIGTFFKNTISDKDGWIAAKEGQFYIVSLFEKNELHSFAITIDNVISNFGDKTYVFDSVRPELAGTFNKKDVQLGKSLEVNTTFIKIGEPFNPFWIRTAPTSPADSFSFYYFDDNGYIRKLNQTYTLSYVQDKLQKNEWLFVSDYKNDYPFDPTNKNKFYNPATQAAATTPTLTSANARQIMDRPPMIGDVFLDEANGNRIEISAEREDSFIIKINGNRTEFEQKSFTKLGEQQGKISLITHEPSIIGLHNKSYNPPLGTIGNVFRPLGDDKLMFWISEIDNNGNLVLKYYDDKNTKQLYSLVSQKELFRKVDIADWLYVSDNPDVILELRKLENAPQVQSNAPTAVVNTDKIQQEIRVAKSNLGALLFIRSTIPIVNFEEIMEVETNINLTQRKIDELNFKLLEAQMEGGDIFDTLFEQSFTDIKDLYEGIYASPTEPVDFFTPDGERSEYSDAINELTRTEKFKEWFGDWQLFYQYKDLAAFDFDSSKVLTQNFEPQVVWHGTGSEFSYFKFDTFPATYFAVNQAYSQFFADLHGGGDGYVLPFFLNIRKPLDLTHFGINKITSEQFFTYIFLETGMSKEDLDVNPLFLDPNLPELEIWVYIRNNPKMLQKLKNTKIVDGIHFYETNPNVPQGNIAYSTEVWVIFEANQCKLADINRGNVLLGSLKSFLLEKGGKV